MSIDSPIQVSVSDRFAIEIRQLAKRYRRIRLDLQPIIDQLEAGELPGDQIPGMDYTLFKVRVKNSDAQRGKSGGYRIIYYLKTATLRLKLRFFIPHPPSPILSLGHIVVNPSRQDTLPPLQQMLAFGKVRAIANETMRS